jgi:hypothetical protein
MLFCALRKRRLALSTALLVVWTFECDVQQGVVDHDFPFDFQIIWLRFRPRTFERGVVLVPDFDSYLVPGAGGQLDYTTRPGGNDFDLVSENWIIEGAYFSLC